MIADITKESKKTWRSSPLATDQPWVSIVTEGAGYFCSIHPVMKGKIIVELFLSNVEKADSDLRLVC